MTQWLAPLVILFAVFTAGHAVLYKRDTRAVIAWVAIIIMVPLAGATLYWLLAVNRVSRKARRLRPQAAGRRRDRPPAACEVSGELAPLARVGDVASPFKLTGGNTVAVLVNGEGTYPRMLAAIEGATSSIALATYIFDGDAIGIRFCEALLAAHERGVAVRVLVDAHGRRNRHGDMSQWLKQAGVPVARFMPSLLSPTFAAFNLRNHRKVMVVDGCEAYTGGMNISGDNLLDERPPHPVQDLHFRIQGEVVGQLMQVFADDWEYTTGERLDGNEWFPAHESAGQVYARALPDGPDEDFETLRLVLLAALAQARHRLAIMTPYFLPDASLIAALNTAALRGVEVHILIPAVPDHKVVRWASQAMYWQLLERGCRIYHSAPPFDHSKLMLVDESWVLIGSTNWDSRSLRLNFELNLECHHTGLAGELWALFAERRDSAAEVTQQEMDDRPFLVKLRDGASRLLTPYL